MHRTIDLEGVRELAARGGQIVEVLPREEYEEMHIPGAVSHPLKELDALRAEQLDRGRAVVVYCWDALCDMSPRAAAWLEQLGFEAYDYALGKVDWIANGMAVEGSAAGERSALAFAREDVAGCNLDDPLVEVSRRIDASPYGFALVLAGGIVLGRVRGSRARELPPDATAQAAMEPGPSTMRPHTEIAEVERRLAGAGASVAILTTPGGSLIGVVRDKDLPRARD